MKYSWLLLLCLSLQGACKSRLAANAPVIFIGSTACGGFIKLLMDIPAGAESDKIKWQLTLYDDSAGVKRFTAVYTWGLQQVNAPGFINNGETHTMQGTWATERGTATDPAATVYRLQPYAGKRPVLLVKMDDNILHFLYSDRHLLIGNAGWGYTLSRVQR